MRSVTSTVGTKRTSERSLMTSVQAATPEVAGRPSSKRNLTRAGHRGASDLDIEPLL